MVQPVVIGAYQHEVGQLGGAAVFPVPDVVGVQTAGGPAARNRAGGVAVLEGTAQPAVDLAGPATQLRDFVLDIEMHHQAEAFMRLVEAGWGRRGGPPPPRPAHHRFDRQYLDNSLRHLGALARVRR